MTTFAYKAKQGPDQTVDGLLEADSRAAALLALDRQGLSPVWVREVATGSTAKARPRRWAGRPVRARDVTVLTRQLASLIRSGVPILRALRTIADQSEKPRMQDVVHRLEATIREGNMLSQAMAAYPALFSPLYLDMVRAGEAAGILDSSLTRLADAREKEDEARRKVQAAIAYPLLVLVVGVVTIFVLLAYFLPKIIVLFENFDDLPLPTRILIAASDVCAGYWHWFVLLAVMFGLVVRRLLARERGRTLLDGLVLRLPGISRFVLEANVARFARTLALLVNAGVGIDQALRLSANTLGNAVLREEIEAVRLGTVQKGAALSEGLKRSRVIPPFVANMTAVGEEAGRLDEALLEVAAFYERQVEQHARLVTSLIEPLLILVVGGLVGFIVAAMLLPIFTLGSGL